MLNSIRVLQHIILHPVRKKSSGDQVHIGGDSRPGEIFDSVRNQVDNSECIRIQLTAGKEQYISTGSISWPHDSKRI
jgi:hypothetical protein